MPPEEEISKLLAVLAALAKGRQIEHDEFPSGPGGDRATVQSRRYCHEIP